MLNPEGQAELLRRLAVAAGRRGLRVAPVGSVFFLYQGRKVALTKDLDAVVHDDAGEPASLEVLQQLGNDLGVAQPSEDKATVTVKVLGLAETAVEIDLIRGKEGSKRGFLVLRCLKWVTGSPTCRPASTPW